MKQICTEIELDLGENIPYLKSHTELKMQYKGLKPKNIQNKIVTKIRSV